MDDTVILRSVALSLLGGGGGGGGGWGAKYPYLICD